MHDVYRKLQSAMADFQRARTHDDMDEAFGVLWGIGIPLETSQPRDGKNVQYYRDRYHNCCLGKHKKWFAAEFYAYLKPLARKASDG